MKNMKSLAMRYALLVSIAPIAINHVTAATAMGKPNIIVIMADDMGYADTGFTGATDIQTPNLDALAKSGVTFTSGYVTHPYCGPSRAGLLSGRYQQRFGFETNPAYDPSNPYMGIDPGETLFPARLQKASYRTGVICNKTRLTKLFPNSALTRLFPFMRTGSASNWYR